MNEIITSALVFAALGGAMGALLALATKLFPIKKEMLWENFMNTEL